MKSEAPYLAAAMISILMCHETVIIHYKQSHMFSIKMGFRIYIFLSVELCFWPLGSHIFLASPTEAATGQAFHMKKWAEWALHATWATSSRKHSWENLGNEHVWNGHAQDDCRPLTI